MHSFRSMEVCLILPRKESIILVKVCILLYFVFKV